MRSRLFLVSLVVIVAFWGCTPQAGDSTSKATDPTETQAANEPQPTPYVEPAPARTAPAEPAAAAPRPSRTTRPAASSNERTADTAIDSRRAPAEPPLSAAAPAAPAAPSSAANSVPAPKRPEPLVLPALAELEVTLADPLNSGKNKVGDEFAVTLVAPLYSGTAVALNRGTTLRGKVLAVEGSGRVSGKASMQLALTEIERNGKSIPISTEIMAVEADGSTGRDAGVIGGGAGVGAIIGAIAGGKKGAAKGAVIGGAAGAGTVLITKGKEVDFPVETRLTFKLDKEARFYP